MISRDDHPSSPKAGYTARCSSVRKFIRHLACQVARQIGNHKKTLGFLKQVGLLPRKEAS